MSEEKVRVDNNTFAASDQLFQVCCELAKVKPCGRQASKFRNGKGIARQFLGEAKDKMEKK